MKHMILSALALLITPFAALLMRPRRKATGTESGLLFANIAEGSHDQVITRVPDNNIATYFLLAKAGTDADHADVCGVNDVPIGVWIDTTTSQNSGNDLTMPLGIALLGARKETLKVAINSSVTLGDYLVPDASGYARTLPAAGVIPANYYVIGRALRAGSAGDVIEVDPQPQRITVAPAGGTFTQTSVAVATTAATNSSPYGYSQAQANAIVTNLNAAIADLTAIKAELNL